MPRYIVAGLSLLISASAHAAALEFSGYLRSTGSLRFVVTDLQSGTKSGWLSIGSTFQGHTVTAFDSDSEILILRQDGKTVRLPLKDSRVQHAGTSSHSRTEVRIAITHEGTPLIDGQAVTFDAFEGYLRKQADAGLPLAVFFHQPLDPTMQVHETVKKLHHAVVRSGVKKWSIKIVDAVPPRE